MCASRRGGGRLDPGNDDDPAARYLRQVTNESRRAFNLIQQHEEAAAALVGASDAGDVTAATRVPNIAGSNLLRRLLPSLCAPPTLPTEALPSPVFVSFTTQHFEFCKEYITAARSSIVAERMKAQRGLRVKCPPRPLNAPPLGADRPTWAAFLARAAVPSPSFVSDNKKNKQGKLCVYGPPLSCIAHTDFVGMVHAICVACQNISRGGNAPRIIGECDASTGASKRHKAEYSDGSGDEERDSSASESSAIRLSDATRKEEHVDDTHIPTAVIQLLPPCVIVVADAGLSAEQSTALRAAVWVARAGGGAWLLAALAGVYASLDPDTTRLLQDAFLATVRHLSVLHALRRDLFSDSTAVPQAAATIAIAPPLVGGEEPGVTRVVVSLADLSLADVRALQTAVVVLGKVFRQANPALIPL